METCPTCGAEYPEPVDPEWTARARTTDPEESHEAARKARNVDVSKRILVALATGDYTTKELVDVLGIKRVSVSPCMKPLKRLGLVDRTGERRDGCAIWRKTSPFFLEG